MATDGLFEADLEQGLSERKFFLDNTFSCKTLMERIQIFQPTVLGLFHVGSGQDIHEYINDPMRIDYVAELLPHQQIQRM